MSSSDDDFYFDELERMMREEEDLWKKIKDDDMWFDAWVSDALPNVIKKEEMK